MSFNILDTKFLELLLVIVGLLPSLLSQSREVLGSLLIFILHRLFLLSGFPLNGVSHLPRHRFLDSIELLLRLRVNLVQLTLGVDGNSVNMFLGYFVKLLLDTKEFQESTCVEGGKFASR